jgi:transcriptional regulator with XRE-family HTH domain
LAKKLLEDLGRRVQQKRGKLGVRAAAQQIGISHATLSRIERGHLPDLENYRKICVWLGEDPEASAMQTVVADSSPVAEVHFRKKPTVTPVTAEALAQMILAAQNFILTRQGGF